MKRLQFRHNNEVFSTRELALQYFSNIVNATNTASTVFESSLYAEPLVAKYLDEDGNTQVIFAIGVDSGLTPYHIIDSKEMAELIAKNAKNIEEEKLRAIAAEAVLKNDITSETNRAIEAETTLQNNINKEQERAESVENNLQDQITNNIVTISMTEPSSANVLEEFVLKNKKGEKLGESIKIYKDSSLVGATIGFKGASTVNKDTDGNFILVYSESERDENIEYLYLIYKDENGELKLVGIDFENFLLEAEFGNGLKILEHVVSIKVKDGDKYLNVDADGLYSMNIDESIASAIENSSNIINEKIDAEISRSKAADEYISGLTADFSAGTVNEFVLVNSAITVETERAMAAELYLSGVIETEIARAIEAELFLSGTIDTERTERIAEDDTIKDEIKSNKINSKDIVVNKTADGTSLTIQTDEITLTKFASAATIYDTNVAVLGTLLRVKKVEPTASNVKSRYELQGADGQLIGDPIEMPIESALVDVKQGRVGDAIDVNTGNYTTKGSGDTTMNFVYRLEDGSYELVQVVVSEYFTDSHFGRGLNNQDGVVSLLEGDGNEYLVIGEDTIAVVGVNNAIAIAKAESETLINEKYESATGYTDQRYNESITHTNTRVDDVVSSVDSLTDTLNTAVESMNNTLNVAVEGMNAIVNSAVEGMNATVNSAVEGFNTLLTESINGVNNSLDAEITNRQNADNVLDGKISGNTAAISSLQSDQVAFSGSIISYVDNAAASAETKANEYTDNLNAAMSERVNALEGDIHTHTNKVELDKIAEGDKAKWDDAVTRLDDFLIGNGVDEVIDTLQDIKDWMKGEGVVATELTEAIAVEAKLREDADTALGTRITALEGINHDAYKEADNVLRTEISTLSGNVLTYVNNEDAKVISAITKNETAIAVLNADKKTEGSVLYRIENEFEKSLITDGVPVTAVSPEEANKVHSLVRQITVNGEMRYYVISDATEMFYVKPRATETAPIETVNLNDYITGLEARIAVLEEKLSGFAGDIEQTIKDLVKSYVVGTTNEIKVVEDEDKLKIGFDDNAIFGDM